MGQLLQNAGKGTRMSHAGGDALGEAPYMELIDNQIPQGKLRAAHIPPVKALGNHPAVILVVVPVILSPAALTGNGSCIRIQQNPLLVEQQSLSRIIWAVHPVGVFKFRNIQPEYHNGKDVSDPVGVRNGDYGVRNLFLPVKQQQLTAGSVGGGDGEIDCIGQRRGAVDQMISRAHLKAVDGVNGNQRLVGNDSHFDLPSLVNMLLL